MYLGIRRLTRCLHTRNSNAFFEPLIKQGYKGINALPKTSDFALQNQDFATSTDEKLDKIVSGFVGPIDTTIGYGSSVFEQDGYEKKPKNTQIDLIHIVENTARFHETNLKKFPNHYSGLKYGGVKLVEFFQNIGTGLYFNPFVNIEDSLTKYGLISRENAQKDLVEWSNLYIAGRLQKPVKFLSGCSEKLQELKLLNQYNLRSALSLSLLLNQDETITERALFRTITALSYLGDPRMLVGGENPNKVKNIVNKQFSNFKKLYNPFINEFVEAKLLIPALTEAGVIERAQNEQRDTEYKVLINTPQGIRLIESLPMNFRKEICRLYNKENFDADQQRTEAFAMIVKDQNLQKNLVKAVVNIVRGPSLIQSLKGFFTSGITKSLKYMWEKRMKYSKSVS